MASRFVQQIVERGVKRGAGQWGQLGRARGRRVCRHAPPQLLFAAPHSHAETPADAAPAAAAAAPAIVIPATATPATVTPAATPLAQVTPATGTPPPIMSSSTYQDHIESPCTAAAPATTLPASTPPPSTFPSSSVPAPTPPPPAHLLHPLPLLPHPLHLLHQACVSHF
ncbi:unnamed protein product [Closterium sp. NIES-54]